MGLEMTGCGKFVKIMLFVSNFIIWVGSIALLIFGIWAVVDKPYLENLLSEQVYSSAAYILIAVGVFAFFVSFLGCFGALKEIKCMLLMYFIFVLLLFIILLVGGILGLVYRNKTEMIVKNGMAQSLKDYDPEDSSNANTRSWDDTQRAMKCCGIDSRRDWTENSHFSTSGPQVPKSCCRTDTATNQITECSRNPTDFNSFSEGCYNKTTDFVMENAKYIGGAGIGVALLMILGLVFSMILFNLIH